MFLKCNIWQVAVMEVTHCANDMLLINLSRPIYIVIHFSIRSDNYLTGSNIILCYIYYALSSLSVAKNRIQIQFNVKI